jgi:hypothetical protein
MRCIPEGVGQAILSPFANAQQRALLAVLFHGEDAMRRRCATVASRLEIASSAMVLLEVACHADASLDDLDRLATARGVVLETVSARVRAWATTAATWVGHLWPAPVFRDYHGVLGAMRQNLAVAAVLRAECASRGDPRMAEWCELWIEQRLGLASRLEASLVSGVPGDPRVAPPYFPLPDPDPTEETVTSALN